MPLTREEWANRWIGGMCTIGIEGIQPIRHATYDTSPHMRELLQLPADALRPTGTTLDDALAAWYAYLGRDRSELQLLLVKDTFTARKLLMRAFGLDLAEPVGLPVNTRRTLSEAVKRSGGSPRFIELDGDLGFAPDSPGLDDYRLVWAEPLGGMPAPEPPAGKTMFVDYGFTLPAPLGTDVPLRGQATVWGLHHRDMEHSEGALIAFHGQPGLYDQALALLSEDEAGEPDLALAQCVRLAGREGLAARIARVQAQAREGMDAAVGLPTPAVASAGLPIGLAVRIPESADMPTFLSYVRSENIPVHWVPELQPIFYVAFQISTDDVLTSRSAERLARWLITPLGPDMNDEEIIHQVLVFVKTADYTGVRWYTDPGRAKWYGNLMFEWYGPTHDAFRLRFPIADSVEPVSPW